ncbi:hypothetical protein ACJ5NV_12060 [Loktanella agnita]|uniref:hypothetical protein n=1 Tax=Loktanella agnita TaxID=287097 RepID=UPI003987FE85
MTDQTSAEVAAAATIADAIDLREFVLLGIIQAQSGAAALLRSPQGDIARVHTGTQVFGYTIAAIGDTQVQLTDRRGTLYALALPGT